MHTIIHAIPQPNHQIQLTYTTGETIIVNFQRYIERGGVFAPLAEPAFFAQVRIGERGRYIEWPGELDFCADALWRTQYDQPQTR